MHCTTHNPWIIAQSMDYDNNLQIMTIIRGFMYKIQFQIKSSQRSVRTQGVHINFFSNPWIMSIICRLSAIIHGL